MKNLFLSLLAMGLITACNSIKKSASTSDFIPFENLELKPSFEPNNFRIDIIRQTTTVMSGENNFHTENVPYNAIGFDLGNGLFYDLNKNLSIRLDYFLHFDEENGYDYQISKRPKQNKGLVNYIFRNDSLFSYKNEKRKPKFLQHIERNLDVLTVSDKRKVKETIYNDGSSFYFAKNKRKINEIQKQSDSVFLLNNKTSFEKSGNNLKIGKSLIVRLSNDNKSLYLETFGILKNKAIFSLKKQKNQVYVFRKNHQQKLISYSDTNLTLSQSTIFSAEKLIEKHHVKNTFLQP